MLKIGDAIPDIRLKDQHGKERSFREFAGKRVVLWYFPKADTPGCTLEGCGFRDQHDAYTKKGVVVLGISFDTPAENKAFAEKFHFPFDMLCDTERALGLALGVATDAKAQWAKRNTFVIGPTGTLEQIIDKVDVKSHPVELLKSLP
ncbi:MAG: peroxiredoxin [Planctomycetota bacterium]